MMKGKLAPGYLAVIRPNQDKRLARHYLKVVVVFEVDGDRAGIDWIDKKNEKHYTIKDVPLELLWEINADPAEYYPWLRR